jgi:hypothetical protein
MVLFCLTDWGMMGPAFEILASAFMDADTLEDTQASTD